MPLVFAGLFILAALGVALYVAFSLIEVRVTGWATRKNDLDRRLTPSCNRHTHHRRPRC